MEGVREIEHFYVVEQEENGKLNKFSKLEANKLVCHVFKWNKLGCRNFSKRCGMINDSKR